MAEGYEALASSICRVFPGSRIEQATEEQLVALRRDHPDAPAHYLNFLERVGWGTLGGSNFTIYSGLLGPDDIFDPVTAAELSGLLFLGDNFGGWMVGFDTRKGWRLVGVTNGSNPCPLDQQTLAEFVSQRLKDAQDDG